MAHSWVYRRYLDGGRARYDTIVEFGVDPLTGRRQRIKRTYLTTSQAKQGLAELLAAAQGGALAPYRATTMATLLDLWLEQCARPRVSERTYLGYAQTVRRHIVPHLGAVAVQAVTPAHLHALLTLLRARGSARAPCSLSTCISPRRSATRRLGWVGRNVADDVERPRWCAKEMSAWTLEEVRRFLAVADQSAHGPLWQLALGTGLRRGEVLGLRWCDLDMDGGLLSIRQTLGVTGGRIVVKPPKTTTSRRTIHLPPTLTMALQRYRLERERHHGCTPGGLSGFVFTTARGTPLHPDNLDRDFTRLAAQAGVRRIRIHDLRHTYATLALQHGMPVHVVSANLGHADAAVTLRIYAHVLPTQRDELALHMDMDATLFGAGRPNTAEPKTSM